MSRIPDEAELILAPAPVQVTFELVATAGKVFKLITGHAPSTKQVRMWILVNLFSAEGTDADAQWLVDAGFMPETFLREWAEYQAL